ncbi:MAG TPA: hypothetical protein VH164_02505 [Ktedonobacteraceae bacterium]|nr:hypothetical protein [Ktedonobacteraceae bacterium]
MSEDHVTHAELRLLHAKMDAVLAMQRNQVRIRHGWLKYVIKDLETNPRTQYKVHLYGAIYWLANFPAVTALFFLAPGLWLQLGIFITLVYSIYANFATDYGAMSAALAAFGQAPLPELPVETHVEAGQ